MPGRPAAGLPVEVNDGTGSWPPPSASWMPAALAVLESWNSFGATTRLPRLCLGRRAGGAGRAAGGGPCVGPARHGAGVLVGAGTDFGGGWLRPNQLPWEVQTLVAAGLEPSDALAAATINGGRLLGEPGAGVLAQGPGRHPARPPRPPDRPGIAVAGVAHQLVTLTHSA
jgi:hypothetical protein